MQNLKVYLEEIFNVAYNLMMFSGGDGCSVIISDCYIDIAEVFEEWLNSNHPNHLGKSEEVLSHSVSFWYDQEGVVFTNDLALGDHNMYEFIVILPSWYSDSMNRQGQK